MNLLRVRGHRREAVQVLGVLAAVEVVRERRRIEMAFASAARSSARRYLRSWLKVLPDGELLGVSPRAERRDVLPPPHSILQRREDEHEIVGRGE